MNYNYAILAPSETAGYLCEEKTMQVANEEERRKCAAASTGQCCMNLVARDNTELVAGNVVVVSFCDNDDCPNPRLPDIVLRELVASETINAAARNQQTCPFLVN